MIDNAPIGVAVVGRDLRYLLANAAYQAIAGRPVVGCTIAEVFPPAVAEIVQPLVQQVLDSGAAAEFRQCNEAPVRGRTWWNVSEIPLRDEAGNTEAVLILTQEVTQHKLAQDAVGESQATLERFYDSAPFLMGVAELDGDRIVAVSGNRAMAEFFETRPGKPAWPDGGRPWHPSRI